MTDGTTNGSRAGDAVTSQRTIWLTLEPVEIIELKRTVLDQDAQGAFDLFERVVLPQVRARAGQRGVCMELLHEAEEIDASLPR